MEIKSSFRTYVNLLATFVIGGLWHGAGWTFIFWGFLHGMALIIHRVWTNLGFKMYTWLAWFITYNFVNIAWIFFRAKSWEDAIKVLKGMLGLSGIVIAEKFSNKLVFLKSHGVIFDKVTEHIGDGDKSLTWILIGLIFVLIFKNSMEQWQRFSFDYKSLFLAFICFIYGILSLNKVSEFLYFNF